MQLLMCVYIWCSVAVEVVDIDIVRESSLPISPLISVLLFYVYFLIYLYVVYHVCLLVVDIFVDFMLVGLAIDT